MRKILSLLMILTITFSITVIGVNDVGIAIGQGKIFLGGGALQDDNSEVWNALYSLSAVTNPKVAVFCSGSPSLLDAQDSYYNDTALYWSWEKLFKNYGFDPVFIPIAIDNYQTAAYDQYLVDIVNNSDVVWFNGGDQSRHSRVLLKNDGTDTPLMTAVRNVFNNGGVIAGSSAGAAIQGEKTYGEGISYGYLEANGMIEKSISDVSLADPSNYDNGGYMKGFGFLSNIDACIDTHVGGRGRIGRMAVAMRELNNRIAIGVDENSAITIENGIGKVYGEYGVLILDGSDALYHDDSYYKATGLKAYSLSSQDSIDFATMSITSSKQEIDSPYYSSAYDSREIFYQDEAFKVMERLVDSDSSLAIGKSKDRKPQFQFRFSKNPYTKGYWSNNKYTVDNLDLDIDYN